MRRTAAITAALAIGCAAVAIPSVAEAQIGPPTAIDVPLSFDAMTPADGTSIVSGTKPTFEISSGGGYRVLEVEVSTQPTLGQDGTLANDYFADHVTLTRSDAYPTKYSGTSFANPTLGWFSTPGGYYWQASVRQERWDPATSRVVFSHAIGPVRRIAVTAPAQIAPPAPRLGVHEGNAIVRTGLRREFGSRFTAGKKFKAHSARLNGTTIRYRVSWARGGLKYGGTVTVSENVNGSYSYWMTVGRR